MIGILQRPIHEGCLKRYLIADDNVGMLSGSIPELNSTHLLHRLSRVAIDRAVRSK
jgi:hypothetical protein